MSIDNSGPAFPRPADRNDSGAEGMTLRDYFAAHIAAAQATTVHGDMDYLNPDHVRKDGKTVAQRIAEISYVLADAMLAERSKSNG